MIDTSDLRIGNTNDQEIVSPLDILVNEMEEPCIYTCKMPGVVKAKPPRVLSSDRRSWKFTLGLLGCGRTIEFPENLVLWTQASNRGAYRQWMVAEDGLAMFMEVATGCDLVLIGKQITGPVSFPPKSSKDVDYVLLQPGTRL